MSALTTKLKDFLRQKDNLGQSIGLAHNDSPTYRSALGGFVTLLTKIGLLSYFFVLFSTAYNQELYTIAATSKRLNLVTDLREFSMDQEQFDFATKTHTLFPIAENEIID